MVRHTLRKLSQPVQHDVNLRRFWLIHKDLAKGLPQPEYFEARLILFPCAPLLAAWLVLSVNNMKTSLSGREPLNGAAEPGLDLLEIDVFDATKSVRRTEFYHHQTVPIRCAAQLIFLGRPQGQGAIRK